MSEDIFTAVQDGMFPEPPEYPSIYFLSNQRGDQIGVSKLKERYCLDIQEALNDSYACMSLTRPEMQKLSNIIRAFLERPD